jgi:molybdopterin molybdotransferase
MQGCERPPLRQTIRARLTHNLASVPGRVDYIQVKLIERGGEVWAEPIFGKSNLIYTLVKADGMLIIPSDANGLAAGEMVDVRLF